MFNQGHGIRTFRPVSLCAKLPLTIPPNQEAYVSVDIKSDAGVDVVMFEPDLAYIQKYCAYPCPGLVGTSQSSFVRLLNADSTTPLTVYMGTVLGNANPVLPICEHFIRVVVLVDSPLHSGPLGPEGEPIERELPDNPATDVSDNDLPFDVCSAVVGYEYPFWPYISPSHAYVVDRVPSSKVALDANMPLITVTDSDGYTVHAGGFVATSGRTDVLTTSTVPANTVLRRDTGAMPRYA